jgi:hypothetical protein
MTLKRWLENRWLKPHRVNQKEVAGLLSIVDRDIKDAGAALSADWRFGIAYNAALKLCTILLHAEGYRAAHDLQHYRTIAAMPLILGDSKAADAEYLDTCRKKRNIVEYERAGSISVTEADELLAFATELRGVVTNWLKKTHPALIARN